jgi:hypothetical protein
MMPSKRHGMTNTRFYVIYRSIIQRTTDKNCAKYRIYGGRGIKCEWKDFNSFFNDMYESYIEQSIKLGEKNISIERKDNNGNYSKKNCCWILLQEQAKNRRNNHYIKYKGTTQTIGDFEKSIGVCRGLVRYHTNKGLSIRQIINYYKQKNAKK